MTDDQWNEQADAETEQEGVAAVATEPQYGLGPFSIREVAILAVWLVAFVVSFFPVYGVFGGAASIWGSGIEWVLRIGVPTAAVFLIVLRRFSPDGIRRVGSLGVDQFASVAFSVAAVLWLTTIWGAFVALGSTTVFLATWVVWVEFVAMLAGVALTVFAPFIPVLSDDFRERPDEPAHRNARAARPVVPRPVAPRPTPAPTAVDAPDAEQAPATTAYDVFPTGPLADLNDTAVSTRLTAAQTPTGEEDVWTPVHTRDTYEPAPAAPVQTSHQAFWALAPVERDVLDDRGVPIFRVGPSAWALVIEDRGSSFVVRHEDGRVGYLHDVTGVTRG
ncbi:hypothetical protein [Microbacterium sp. CJ88]|uniref:hypothetical protein n=1 Tax=Microbacterium sp. CJ88 TaxID=3445672 RepID=UPI003F65D6AF